MDQFTEKTYGLAGIFQAATLVQQVACTGEAQRFAKQASLNSILVLDAVNALSVYSDRQGIELGLRQIQLVFGESRDQKSLETFQYVAKLSQLAKLLMSDNHKMSEFGPKVEGLSAFSGDELIEAMADIYKEFISGMEPRVLVNGEQGFLAQDEIAQQVRAFLLSGIRSAFLWHQKGGSRWDFLLKRAKYLQEANRLLLNG